MNRSLLLLCCLALCACSEPRPAVVLRPAFDVRNTQALEIDKIELTDSATIFYFDAFYRPKSWISIDRSTYLRESGGDSTWTVVKAEGIELSEKFWMPDSGRASFKLFFPPLPPTVSRVDFIESDCEECFKIWGIRLLPSDKVSIAPAPATAAVEALPPVRYNPQLTRISGQLIGYVKGMKSNAEVMLRLSDMVTTEDLSLHLPVADDGSFSGEAVVPQLSYTILTCDVTLTSFSAELYIAPGKDLNVLIDLRKQSRLSSRHRTDKSPEDSIYIYPSGSYLTAQDVHALYKAPRIFNYKAISDTAVGMNPSQYKDFVLGLMNEKLSQTRQAGYSPNAQAVRESLIKFITFQLLIDVPKNTKAGNATSTKALVPQAIDLAYFSSFLSELLDGSMIITSGVVVDFLRSTKLTDVTKDGRTPNDPPFAFIKKHIVALLGVDTGAVYNLAMARFYGSSIHAGFYTDDDKAMLKSALIPEYAQVLIDANDRAAKEFAALKTDANITINKLPDVSPEKMLEAIVAKYRGKVVLVDFWNTWCGPCMRAHKAILPLKEELKGKEDVVFVYIADESSPLPTWNKAIPIIHGEHYRVSSEQIKKFDAQGYVSGFPTYLIFDKQGKQSYKHTGFPGVDELRKELAKNK
ncbi:MAG: TlpA family protein disulfide reductase [Prevotellaceae bacterium]|jgi:thiol-disulfide isomerase/thioredoxin|nr:TlpA family protein disulfide reductase [Prevotellaceae bacterium]